MVDKISQAKKKKVVVEEDRQEIKKGPPPKTDPKAMKTVGAAISRKKQ